MSNKITLDRDTFRALAADTRVDILKMLSERKLTLTDLAKKTGMSPSTIKEHLDRLVGAGLIAADDKGMKWKYYRLTRKGENILTPNETKVWIVLGTTAVGFLAGVLSLASKLPGMLNPESPMLKTELPAAGMPDASGAGAARLMEDGAVMIESFNESLDGAVMAHAGKDTLAHAVETTTTIAAPLMDGPAMPWLELSLILVSATVAIACIMILFRNRRH
jgi:DNA-binding transcriptional ArsR family regulator